MAPSQKISGGYNYETNDDVDGMLARVERDGADKFYTGGIREGEDSKELLEAVREAGDKKGLDAVILKLLADFAARLPSAARCPEKQRPGPDWQKILLSVIKDAQTKSVVGLRRSDANFIVKQIINPQGTHYDVLGIKDRVLVQAARASEDNLDQIILLSKLGLLTKKWLSGWTQAINAKSAFIKSIPEAIRFSEQLATTAPPGLAIAGLKVPPYWKLFLAFMTVIEKEFSAAAKDNKPISSQDIFNALGVIGNFYGTPLAVADLAVDQALDRKSGALAALSDKIFAVQKTGFDTTILENTRIAIINRNACNAKTAN